MRVKIVFGLLIVLLAGLGFMLITRERAPHQMPQPPAASASAASSSAAALASASASASGAATPPDAGPVKLMDRPLRTVTLGWDLAAPAVLANGGVDPGPASDFTAGGVDVHLRAVDAMSAVESALARGGADKDGADVAVVPFCELVASYERLRALTPEVFFVVGWSRGREALVSTQAALPPPVDRPTIGADAGKGGVSMVGVGGEAATFLGLYALDANGTPPGAVRLVAPGGKSDDPPLAAVDRDALPADGARHSILLTTADASRLIPFVAVAQHGLIERNGKALAAWARAWIEGARKLAEDPPVAARQIAAAPGAPEPLALLKRLGEITPASLGDNARAVGLSGRGALTLEALFQQSWQIWRAAGVLATPAPEASPINVGVIAALARESPALARPAPPAKAQLKPPAAVDGRSAVITFRQLEGKLDEAALLASAGLFADVFERSTLRVAVAKGAAVDAAATKKLIDGVEQRFDVTPGRLVPARKPRPQVAASIEILAAP